MFGQFRMGEAVSIGQDNCVPLIRWQLLETMAQTGIRGINRRYRNIQVVVASVNVV